MATVSMSLLAEKDTGMNWELSVLKQVKVNNVLESAKDSFPHECKTELVPIEKNDGGPYGSLNNATFWYLQVIGPSDTDPRFVQGIKDVLEVV